MHPQQFSITPGVVRSLARKGFLSVFPWSDYGRKASANSVCKLLLMAAAMCYSLSYVVKRFRFGYSHETARQAVYDNLPDLPTLTDGLVDALFRFLPRSMRRRKWVVAIDEHRCPYYGGRNDPGVTGGNKKHGSKYAHAYASAVIVHRGRRFTVGLLPLTESLPPHQIVEALLEQMESRGLKLRGVVLDSAFESGETLLLLQERGLSYAVPLRRKGKRTNRRNQLWDCEPGTTDKIDWKTDKTKRPVSTAVIVLKFDGQTRVYAFGGWDENTARKEIRRGRLARRWYRKRFGIETSYRQMNQGKIFTTTKDLRFRLLAIGLALLLRQVWAWLTMQIARDRGLKLTAWVKELPLATMCSWLAESLNPGEEKVIRLSTPLLELSGGKV